MDKVELAQTLAELILNNSSIEADGDDTVFFDGLEDVMTNVTEKDADVTLMFTDGHLYRIAIERIE